ncbi:serine/threonine-protein kinase-like protein At1g28390 [Aristolochia californica]|uniref:serine/threonine-protein kinase-like protein At1g28390 n=1 Tax=Aristolochia californica TaxID=171875 RepID=UPI0035DA8889
MGYLSCRNQSAVSTCDSRSTQKTKKTTRNGVGGGLRHFGYEELESATSGFSHKALLGKGSHGCVYKGLLDNGKLVVAVKVSTPSGILDEYSVIGGTNGNYCSSPGENEIEVLSRLRSPRFVNLLGFSLDEKRLIVVEFMANGNLYDQLHTRPRPHGWARRVRFALQTARAVEMLHASDPPVIHRDIKSSNVLIDEHWNARLGDFGLALRGHVEDVRLKSTPPAGTLGYLDPGYVTPENLSTKSDVFSYGILLLEIISGRNAIDVNYSPSSLVDWALPLIRRADFDVIFDPRIGPPKDLWVGRQLAVLAARCVGSGVDERPTMGEVVNHLKVVRKRVPMPIWNEMAHRVRNRKVSSVQYGVDCCERID